ncbi:molecular chaperone DnaJ [Actinoplanes sp. ATCC 53533]|uniref:molecular chaperone DnaJ n=1 Tax=Actinoplanes sp. ATCC 53533 TaxID=1288362 RepID=UPI000F771786|nr:molecular chaperone DnaJ [Actinoplanes sp. ATCC 53533]RSM54672.1 molecular chaperone DnaJ [Actinoplanes sp. ATCC 53533]
MTFDEAVAAIAGAGSFADLVAACAPLTDAGPGVAGGQAGHAYRILVKVVHPDVAPAGRSPAATAAFARLGTLWRERDGRLLTTKRATYRVGGPVATGDIAELRAVDGDAALLKLPRSPGDNDLLRAEAAALTTLAADGDPKFRAYAPRLLESFTHEDAGRARRTANVIARQRGFVSLAEVHAGYPGGLDPRDVAWMWRRLFTGLGWAHRAGLVHGAVLPEHVLVHPDEHGLVLVDWCYSVPAGATVPALVARHRAAYPPEVTAKQPATAATDIFMATGLMLRLIRNPPDALRRFARGCRYDKPRMRPQDAWHLLGELDELLDDLYGPRRFRPFAMPA